ncbi:MAG: hypothetical protein GDA42_11290 [Ekhidna sp.]|nr:hypothetical protein [Ekhidna sp.]
MNRLFFFFLLTYFASSGCLLAQDEEDPYSDYSYLWKAKKKKRNQKPSVAATDSLLLQPADSSGLDSIPGYSFERDSTDLQSEPKEKQERVPIADFRTPLMSQRQGGNFTGGFTYTTIGDETFVGMVLSPEFAVGKVGVGLNVPLLYGSDSQTVRTEIFKGGVGPVRLIRSIRYGTQKREPAYVKVGQLDGTMIGFGGLVNNYSNTVSFEQRKVGLHFDVNYKGYAGLEGMYSDFDFVSQNLLVIRPYVRPMAFTDIPVVSTLEFGATVVSDKDQTSSPASDATNISYTFTDQGVNAFGLDVGMTVLRKSFIQIDLFANYSNLSVANDSLQRAATVLIGDNNFSTGSGLSFGANFRLHFIADVFITDIRLERMSYKDHYLPQFFDVVYETDKDAKIFGLITAGKKNGIYGSLTGHVLQKVQLGGSLMIPDDVSETSPAVVRIHADMERFADKFSFHGSYVKGNLADLGDVFKLDERSLAKLRFIYHINKFLAAGVDYYYAFTRVEGESYEVTKTVMPYFGVSIDF